MAMQIVKPIEESIDKKTRYSSRGKCFTMKNRVYKRVTTMMPAIVVKAADTATASLPLFAVDMAGPVNRKFVTMRLASVSLLYR